MSILLLKESSGGSNQESAEPQNQSPTADRWGWLEMTTRNRIDWEGSLLLLTLLVWAPGWWRGRLGAIRMRPVLKKVSVHQTLFNQSSLLSPIQVFLLHPDLWRAQKKCRGVAVGSAVGVTVEKAMGHLMDQSGALLNIHGRWLFREVTADISVWWLKMGREGSRMPASLS